MIFVYLLFTLFALSLSIIFHELGHFITALSTGALVKEFSLGFGPPIKSWTIKGIKFSVRSIFLGGFVKVVGDDPNDPDADNPRSFKNLGFWKRLLILLSGVISNLFFAMLILFFIFLVGFQVPVSPLLVRDVRSGSPAANAGIEEFDIIYQVNNTEIRQSQDLLDYIQERGGQSVSLSILRNEQDLYKQVTPYYDEEVNKYLLGVIIEAYTPPIVKNIHVNSSAQRAGIQKGDQLYTVEGIEIYSFTHFQEELKKHSNEAVDITIIRNGDYISKKLFVELITIQDYEIVNSGIEPEFFREEKIRYSLLKSAGESVRWVGFMVHLNIVSIGELIRGSIPFRQAVGGPVGIVQFGVNQAQVGQASFWRFVAILNIALFLFNLLPIPLLDGGHILFLCIETIINRPIPQTVLTFINQIFFVLLIAFAIFITLNDILKILH